MPGEQLFTDLGRVDVFAAQYRDALGGAERDAAFYGMDGLAREFAGSADAVRDEADAAMGLALAAEAERDEALRTAEAAVPRDESDELLSLRAQVAELTGRVATAEAATKSQAGLRRKAEETLAAEQRRHEQEVSALRRRLGKTQGALAVTRQHTCRPEDVPHMEFAGVVGSMRVWTENTIPGRQEVIVVTHQDPSGERVTLTTRVLKRQTDEGYEAVPYAGEPGELPSPDGDE